jgi:hypothetical protein
MDFEREDWVLVNDEMAERLATFVLILRGIMFSFVLELYFVFG